MPEGKKPTEQPTKKAEEKKKEKKVVHGKKPHKNNTTSQKWKFYKIEGNKIIRERNCPRCGPGVFLAKSRNRLHCGRCHYTEFLEKKSEKEEPKEEKKE